MAGLPTLKVELDDGTGTFPYDITSKCLLGPGFNFTRGRDDWQGGVEAASISLTLNNSDGRFSPGSTIIATPTPIKVDQRIRIKETINGITFNRFTGYVKSWPVAWPAVVPTFSTVQITVTDAQARAERHELRSVIEEETLADLPAAYYATGEAVGAVGAADSSGNQAPVFGLSGSGAAVTFGAGTAPRGLTAATFAGGKYLSARITAASIPATSLWFATTASNVALLSNAEGIMTLGVGASGQLKLNATAAFGPVVNDGLLHHVFCLPGRYVIDGVEFLTGFSAPVGGGTYAVGADLAGWGYGAFVGSVSGFAFHSTSLSSARVAQLYEAGTGGFAGESGTARLTRLAGYAGLPTGTLDASLTNVAAADTAGQKVWEALQQVADAEGGVVFIDGSGNLIFHNRNRSPAKTTPDIQLTALAITPDVQPVTDDQQLVNYLEASSETTGVAQVVQNATSIASHGKYPSSVAYLVQTDAEALDRANWLVTNFAEPTTRYGTLTINLYGLTAALAQSILTAIEVNCWLRITGAPSQTPGSTTVDVVVEGYTEELTADSWTLSCNVVSRSLFTAFILDSATFGVLDSSRLYF